MRFLRKPFEELLANTQPLVGKAVLSDRLHSCVVNYNNSESQTKAMSLWKANGLTMGYLCWLTLVSALPVLSQWSGRTSADGLMGQHIHNALVLVGSAAIVSRCGPLSLPVECGPEVEAFVALKIQIHITIIFITYSSYALNRKKHLNFIFIAIFLDKYLYFRQHCTSIAYCRRH